jgi:hypothetical protein
MFCLSRKLNSENRIFAFIDHLANDTSAESSAAATAIENSIFSRKNLIVTDENVTQVHVLQMLKVLINQSSKSFLRVKVQIIF